MSSVINRFPATIVVAVARNGVIGRDNSLPWKLSSDLQRFKRLTMGHALIMGRKTYESIGRPLPGRTTIVLSRSAKSLQSAQDQKELEAPTKAASQGPATPKLLYCEHFEEAIDKLPQGTHPFVVGGSEIYKLTLPLVNRIWITRILADVAGDAYMPEWPKTPNAATESSINWPPGDWKLTFQESVPAGPKDEWPTCFEEWVAI
ncbi:MAG: dihydrofolate reductase [Planctomycetota bacterium]|nr:dihydrofolate reductase [Planctomycetota bacterium]